MFKNQRSKTFEKNNSFKKPKENNRWKRMDIKDNSTKNVETNSRFNNSSFSNSFSNSFSESNEKGNRFKNRRRGGRIHKSRYSKEAFNSKMNNERGATQRNVSFFQGNLNKAQEYKEQERKNKALERRNKELEKKNKELEKKNKNSFFEAQPKMSKSDKAFILNYYCQEQENESEDKAENESENEAEEGNEISFIEQSYISNNNNNKKDIISF